MRSLLAMAFVLLLPSVLAQMSENGCNVDGTADLPGDIISQRTGVFVEFLQAEVACRNLGGLGPDTDCPPQLRYENIGTDFGMNPGTEDDMSVDLVVTNLTEYKANNIERNGLTENGLFGQVNLRDDFEAEFDYSFVKSGTDERVSLTTGVSLWIFDIDFGESMRLKESLKFFPPEPDMPELPMITTITDECGDAMRYPPDRGQACLESTPDIVIDESLPNPMITVTATERGSGGDNAKNTTVIFDPVADLDPNEKIAATRYVKLTYPANMGSFRVRYSITAAAEPGSSGRNFQLYVRGGGTEKSVFTTFPCYFCDPAAPETKAGCTACGGSRINDDNTDIIVNPTKCVIDPTDDIILFPTDCLGAEFESTCTPDAGNGPGFAFPDCLEQCAVKCREGLDQNCPGPTDLNPFTPPPSPTGGPPPFPPSFPPIVQARKDPHLYFWHGGRADFRGVHNASFAMLSARDVAFNVLIEEADFNWAKRLVHGTKMAAAYWVVRTSTGKMLRVEYNATSRVALVHEDGHRDVEMKEEMPPVVVDNVQISLKMQTLSVIIAGKWELAATIAAFPFGNRAANKNKRLLDISIDALYDADHDVVAPHGIMGQAYDGDDIGVSGKMDKSGDGESTTSAQAEGAIEGSWVDYMLTSPFSTKFKYSRFDAAEAKPRDVSKLTGIKKVKTGKNMVGATDLPTVY